MSIKSPLSINVVIDRLKTRYNILDIIHITSYDYRMDQLYSLLKKLKKLEFDPKDQIVFLFDDTEYYFLNSNGLTTHNLQRILYDLDIPNYFCIVITHQTYLLEELRTIRSLYGKDQHDITGIELWVDLFLKIDTIPNTELNFDQIEKPYIFLSRVNRKHRIMLFSLLKHTNILDNGLVSFGLGKVHPPNDVVCDWDDSTFANKMSLITLLPWTRCNESWLISDENLNNLYDNLIRSYPQNYNFKNFIEPEVKFDEYYSNTRVIQRGFLYVGIETMFEYPGVYLSEKSFKGFAAKRPFIIVGPQGNLKKLKEYGFKTFDRWWDESYDDISDSAERIYAVHKIIQSISKKSINELIELGNEMKDVLEYNYDYLINRLAESQLKKLDTQCIKNLNR